MKRLLCAILTLALLCAVSLAPAETLEPVAAAPLAGRVHENATVGEFDEESMTFTVTLYEADRYDAAAVGSLKAGDSFLAGGWLYRVRTLETDEYGDLLVTAEDGAEFLFTQLDEEHVSVMSLDDDRRYMHVVAVLHLPAAEGIVYEDASDPDAEEPVITSGLEDILKIKLEKEETSIGFNYYATLIELNEDLQIVRIHQDFDVAQ